MTKMKGVLSTDYHIQREIGLATRYRLGRRTDEVIRSIKTNIEKSQLSLLDIGTADGLMLERLNRELNLKTSIGIDFSSELLKFAKNNHSYFIQSDASKLPFKDEFFDVVIACAIIEHVPSADKMIVECNRILKKGGLCIITTPSPFFEHIATMIGHIKEDEHNETFDLKKLRSLLISHEFEILHLEKFMMSPIGFPYEITIEKIIKSIRLQFLLLNQLVAGRKL